MRWWSEAAVRYWDVSVLRIACGHLPSLSSSPSVSPRPGSSHRKSPTFLFSTTSDPGTSSFSGFGFDMGSAQEEVRARRGRSSLGLMWPCYSLFNVNMYSQDSPFAFTSSYFSGKVLLQTPQSMSIRVLNNTVCKHITACLSTEGPLWIPQW